MPTLIIQTSDGVAGANVYQDLASAVAWLDDQGLPRLGQLIAADGALALYRATTVAERWARNRVWGSPLTDDQRLLFPRLGAVDRRRIPIIGLPPASYTEGVLMLANELANTSNLTLPSVAGRIGLQSERVGDVAREYTRGGIAEYQRYPEIWEQLSTAWPPGLRQSR